MKTSRTWRSVVFSDLGVLILLAVVRCLPLLLTNGQSGWHRDELDTLDNARTLAWGYVSYPRVALTLFGPAMAGVRLFSTPAQAIALVLAGLMARELGGRRWAQVVAAVAVMTAPFALLDGALFHYSSFDYLWGVLIATLMIRLLKYWLRGYGDPPPETLIELGMSFAEAQSFFESCRTAGVVANRFGVKNEETRDHPVVQLCRGPRQPWPELWPRLRSFG